MKNSGRLLSPESGQKTQNKRRSFLTRSVDRITNGSRSSLKPRVGNMPGYTGYNLGTTYTLINPFCVMSFNSFGQMRPVTRLIDFLHTFFISLIL